jgi:hypothetical protein
MTADLTRYPVIVTAGQLAIECTDCGDPANPLTPLAPMQIWTEDDASEQVTELCLANLVAIAEQHEREHHADEPSAAANAARRLEHSRQALTVGEAIIALIPGAAGVIRP